MKKTTFAGPAKVAALTGLACLALTALTACSSSSPAARTTTPSLAAAAPGSATPASGPATAAPVAAHGDSTRYQASGWLPANRLPLNGTYRWVSENTDDPKSTEDTLNWMYACSDGTKEPTAALEISAYQTKQYKTDLQADPRAAAFQWMLFFKDESAAKAALSTIENDYTYCAARGTDDAVQTTVVKTAAASGGFSWVTSVRDKSGKPHTKFADVGSDAHEFFVQSGNVIALDQVLGDTPAVDPAPADDQVLGAMAEALRTLH